MLQNDQYLQIYLTGITRSPSEKHPEFWKIANSFMILINTGILIYPVIDSAERGLVFSKYRFLEHFGDLKLI